MSEGGGQGEGAGREKEEGRSAVTDGRLGHPGVWRTGGGLQGISHCLDHRSLPVPKRVGLRLPF